MEETGRLEPDYGGAITRRISIPRLYETEDVPLERKTVYQRYQIRPIGFYWLIAELDQLNNLAFGYANLNNDSLAEWGYINIDELLENGATEDKEWEPCSFRDALKRVEKERKRNQR